MNNCADCGGSGSDLKVADSPKGCCTYSIKTPCLTCSRVVSVEFVRMVFQLVDNDGAGGIYDAGKALEAREYLRAARKDVKP